MTNISRAIAISSDAQRTRLLEGLIEDTDGFDVIGVQSFSLAYSQIREQKPDLVILLMEIDDGDACQLLSMLAADPTTRRIPVINFFVEPGDTKPTRCLPERDLLSGQHVMPAIS